LIDRLQGRISVDSTEGIGSTFTVTLPVDQVQMEEEAGPPSSRGTLAVFCLHPATREAVGNMWRKYGYQIVERSVQDPVSYFETASLIWTEALALEAHPSLLQHISAENSGFDVPICVPYADDTSLAEHLAVFTSPCGALPGRLFADLDSFKTHSHSTKDAHHHAQGR
jgi:hypothetical protein